MAARDGLPVGAEVPCWSCCRAGEAVGMKAGALLVMHGCVLGVHEDLGEQESSDVWCGWLCMGRLVQVWYRPRRAAWASC